MATAKYKPIIVAGFTLVTMWMIAGLFAALFYHFQWVQYRNTLPSAR